MNAVLDAPFSEQFREPGELYLSPTKMAEAFGLKSGDIAKLAHVHRNTVSARPAADQLQKTLRDLLRVLSSATEMTGDESRAAFLVRNEPLRSFDHKTALELVAEGRVDDVLKYLESLAGGAAG